MTVTIQVYFLGLSVEAHKADPAWKWGNEKITRGAVCHIGGTNDLFISLAQNNEHDGWEKTMSIVGFVPEPAITEIVEKTILALPHHDFVHPDFGTVMSMLDKELPVVLKGPPFP